MTHSISLIAPAKLNLNLSVKDKLKNGYHSLDSDVCFLDLHDKINIEISNLNKIKFSIGEEIPIQVNTKESGRFVVR